MNAFPDLVPAKYIQHLCLSEASGFCMNEKEVLG